MSFLVSFIDENQAGYVKDRNIVENIRTMVDIIHYTKIEKLPGLMISIDFQKAFDSVSWKFLYLTLKKFNFGTSFIHWIETLYTHISSCIINPGTTSPYFKISRGVRQGDPLSPYLFLLVVEILGSLIRDNEKIKGIKVDGKCFKVLQYADDTNGLLLDLESAKYFLYTVEEFGM